MQLRLMRNALLRRYLKHFKKSLPKEFRQLTTLDVFRSPEKFCFLHVEDIMTGTIDDTIC